VILMIEIWKDIEGFDGYQISNFGRVKSLKKPNAPIIMKQQLSRKGYCHVHITANDGSRKSCQVHRLVLKTFSPCDNMDNLEVNHIDEDKTNNCIDNLEWSTRSENVNHGTASIRAHTSQSDQILCVETGIIYNSMREASELTGTNYGNLSRACKTGRICNGYHWENLTQKRY